MSKSTGRHTNAQRRLLAGAFATFCVAAVCALAMLVQLPEESITNSEPAAVSGTEIASSDADATEDLQPATQPAQSKAARKYEPSSEYDREVQCVVSADGTRYQKDMLLMGVKEGSDASSVNQILESYDFFSTKDVSNQDLASGFVELELTAGADPQDACSVLAKAGITAQPNYVYRMADVEDDEELEEEQPPVDDPDLDKQWALGSLNAYKAWNLSKGSNSTVSVAVIDSGCLTTHVDLSANIRATYNSYKKTTSPYYAQDKSNHGTHVAGIISARANNAKGIAGVSYNAGLVIIKATTSDAGQDFSTSTLINAYDWLLNQKAASGKTNAKEHNVRVINMSIGAQGTLSKNDLLAQYIDKAYEQGILTVCAAGNASSTPIPYNDYPGDYAHCLSVINLRHYDSSIPNDAGNVYYVERDPESNYNLPGTSSKSTKTKDVCAPGTRIWSTSSNSRGTMYEYKSGTSMASPYAAGVAALMFAKNPSLTAEQAMAIIKATAKDIGQSGWDLQMGYGEIDAYKSVRIAGTKLSYASTASAGQVMAPQLTYGNGLTADPFEWKWTSSDPSVLSVNASTGNVTVKGSGSARITATYRKSPAYSVSCTYKVNASKKASTLSSLKDIKPTIVLSAATKAYTGKAIKPKVTVKNGSAKLPSSAYIVSYKNNKNVGKATVTVTLKGSYFGSASKTFTIVPKRPTIKKITRLKSAAVLQWAKQTKQVTGYQIKYSTYRSFKTYGLRTIPMNSMTRTSLYRLYAGKRYYVKMRTYKNVSGKTYYSAWTKVHSFVTKR